MTHLAVNPLAALLLAHWLTVIDEAWPNDEKAEYPKPPEPDHNEGSAERGAA